MEEALLVSYTFLQVLYHSTDGLTASRKQGRKTNRKLSRSRIRKRKLTFGCFGLCGRFAFGRHCL